jgi:hypothetical protein
VARINIKVGEIAGVAEDVTAEIYVGEGVVVGTISGTMAAAVWDEDAAVWVEAAAACSDAAAVRMEAAAAV